MLTSWITAFEFNEEIEQLVHLKQTKISASSIALDAAHSVAFHTGLGDRSCMQIPLVTPRVTEPNIVSCPSPKN